MFCLREISYTYSTSGKISSSALEGIDLEILPGSFTAIIGPNGSGKSTLAKILAGLIVPTSGQIFLDGKNISTLSPDVLRKTVGLVLANPTDQIVFPIVEDDLAFGLENFQVKPALIYKKVTEILDLVGMTEYRSFPIHRLSDGQRQKIAIASMLILGLKYLILDQPTSFLDDLAKTEILSLLQSIHKQGTTVIYIAQSFDELRMADRIVALVKGKIQWQGSWLELLEMSLEMTYWGIEVPVVVELVDRLRQAGFALNHPIYSLDHLLLELKKIKKRIKEE